MSTVIVLNIIAGLVIMIIVFLMIVCCCSSQRKAELSQPTLKDTGPRSAALLLLMVNLALYFVIMVISGWAVNHAIEKTHESASVLQIPARIFPIYFPFGNMATGFFIIFSLLVGVLGMTNSLLGMYNVMQWSASSLFAASTSSLGTWALTVLAMGLACKEINIGYTDSNLRTLEVMMIIVSGTQLLCTGAIHVSADYIADSARRMLAGRV